MSVALFSHSGKELSFPNFNSAIGRSGDSTIQIYWGTPGPPIRIDPHPFRPLNIVQIGWKGTENLGNPMNCPHEPPMSHHEPPWTTYQSLVTPAATRSSPSARWERAPIMENIVEKAKIWNLKSNSLSGVRPPWRLDEPMRSASRRGASDLQDDPPPFQWADPGFGYRDDFIWVRQWIFSRSYSHVG